MATPYSPPPGPPLTPAFAPPSQAKLPGTIVAACILWIIFGSLDALGALASIGRAKATSMPGLFIGVAFVITGIQVLMGKAKSVLASGIVCLVLAGVGLLGIAVLMSMAHGHGAGLILVIAIVPLGLLITSGILAIVGNAKYKEWRRLKGL